MSLNSVPRGPGIEHQEQDAFLRAADQFARLIEVELPCIGVNHSVVAVEPAAVRGVAFDAQKACGRRVLARGERLPLLEIDLRKRGILHQNRIVRLRAEAGLGPVGAAGPDRLRRLVRIADHEELVVCERARRGHAVVHVAHAQSGARVGVLVVALVLDAAVAQARYARACRSACSSGISSGSSSSNSAAIDMAAVPVRLGEQADQLVMHRAAEEVPDLVARRRDDRRASCVARMCLGQQTGEPLARDDAAIEEAGDSALRFRRRSRRRRLQAEACAVSSFSAPAVPTIGATR